MCRKDYILGFANECRNLFKLKTPITKDTLKEVIERLGGELEVVSALFCDETVLEAYGDMAKPAFRIVHSERTSEECQILEILQALGVLLLYCLGEGGEIRRWMEDLSSVQQRECELFAMAIAMPEHEVLDYCKKNCNEYGLVDIATVAKHFRVPALYILKYGKILKSWSAVWSNGKDIDHLIG